MANWLADVLKAAPEWIAAVGTGGAFVIAARAYRTTVRDAHARQARLVQAYLDGAVDWHDYGQSGPSSIRPGDYVASYFFPNSVSGSQDGLDVYLEDDCTVARVVLDNRSNEFVHDVTVRLATTDGKDVGAELHIDTCPPETKSLMLAVLEPNGFYLDGLRAKIRFTDAAGTRWDVEYGRSVREIRR